MREDNLTPETFVYRGAKLPLKIFEEYKDIQNKNEKIILRGFTRTSIKKKEAIKFMFTGLSNKDIPVLYQINNLSEVGLCYFILDNSEYSLFSYEQEVLLKTDSDFTILEISEEEHQSRKY
jgi:hypothetical protein